MPAPAEPPAPSALVELRVLDGANLYFPRPAVKLTLDPESSLQKWILERNGFPDVAAAAAHLERRSRILDAGCGNGRVTALLATLAPHASVTGADLVDLAPARANTAAFGNVTLANADLRQPLARLGEFDFIYCQEVLHHTGDAEAAFRHLAALLVPGGEIAIYVYRKKAPAREYMDEYVRGQIAALGYDDAMEVCRQIADLGRRLSAVTEEIELPDIPVLGLEKGTYTPQRVLYHFFLKCYWNPDLLAEDNAVVNYDWYQPQDSSKHTLEEVLAWFSRGNLEVVWRHLDPYGITVRGVRK